MEERKRGFYIDAFSDFKAFRLGFYISHNELDVICFNFALLFWNIFIGYSR